MLQTRVRMGVSTTHGVHRSNQSTTRSIAESQLIAQNIMLITFVYKKNIQITVFPIHMSTDEQVMIIMQYQISPKDKSSDRWLEQMVLSTIGVTVSDNITLAASDTDYQGYWFEYLSLLHHVAAAWQGQAWIARRPAQRERLIKLFRRYASLAPIQWNHFWHVTQQGRFNSPFQL